MADNQIESKDEVFLDVDNRRFALVADGDELELRVYISGKLAHSTHMTRPVAALLGAMIFTKAASK